MRAIALNLLAPTLLLTAACGGPDPGFELAVEDAPAGAIGEDSPGASAPAADRCGAGRVYDPSTGQCLGTGPGWGARLDALNVRLGDFELRSLDVPAALHSGYPQELTFSITNHGAAPAPVTSLRLLVTPASAADRDQHITAVLDDSKCTNTCRSANNFDCEDRVRPATWGRAEMPAFCEAGTDCDDCRPAASSIDACTYAVTNEQGPDGRARQRETWSCSKAGFLCQRAANNCVMKVIPVAALAVEDLAAGEIRTVKMTLDLPHDVAKDYNGQALRALLTVNEERVVKGDDGQTEHDPLCGDPVDETSLQQAEAIAAAGEIRLHLTDKPDIEMLAGAVDLNGHAFELDFSARRNAPAFRVNAKVMARGKDYLPELSVSSYLELPGHVGDPGWEGSARPAFRYDAARIITLDAEGYLPGKEGLHAPVRMRVPQRCLRPAEDGTCSGGAGSLPRGREIDLSYVLHISRLDAKLLSETLRPSVKALYPQGVINQDNEIRGNLVLFVEPPADAEARPDGGNVVANNIVRIPVVFMAPPAAQDALDAGAGARLPEPAEARALGPYAEVDELTPTIYDRMGGEWIGAGYQLKNISSKERKDGAIVKQRVEADNFIRAWMLMLKYDFFLLRGHVDVGTQRQARSNSAALTAKLMNTTLVDLSMADEARCRDNHPRQGVETCDLAKFDPTADRTPNSRWYELVPAGMKEFAPKPFRKRLCKGPLCLMIQLEIAAQVGVRGEISFSRDTSQIGAQGTGPYSIQLAGSFGPFARLHGTAFGGISVILARAGIEGQCTFIEGELVPSVSFTVHQQKASVAEASALNDGKACWMRNEGELVFSGEARLKQLFGKIRVVFYAGIKEGPFDFEYLIWSHDLVELDPLDERKWTLWYDSTLIKGGGLCKGAPHPDRAWQTPTQCLNVAGAPAYCGNSDASYEALHRPNNPNRQTAYYKRFHLGPSGCATLNVDGAVDAIGDTLQINGVLQSGKGPRSGEHGISFVGDEDPCKPGFHLRHADPDQRTEPLTKLLTCAFDPAPEAHHALKLRTGGDFDKRKIRVCRPDFVGVDLFLNTDATTVSRGVGVTIERDEGPESEVYTDLSWKALYRSEGQRGYTRSGVTYPADSDFDATFGRFDYDGPPFKPVQAQCCSQRAARGGVTVADRRTKMKSLYLEDVRRDPAPSGGDFDVLFRRPMLAAGSRYEVVLECDDFCAFVIDGKSDPSWAVSSIDGEAHFTIQTRPGEMHMLGIGLGNRGGHAGAAAAIKKTAE